MGVVGDGMSLLSMKGEETKGDIVENIPSDAVSTRAAREREREFIRSRRFTWTILIICHSTAIAEDETVIPVSDPR